MFSARRIATIVLPALFLLTGLFGSSNASAQFTFTALEGVSTAQKKITDSLGTGSKLVAIATVGNLDIQGIPLEFNVKTGESIAWIYAFNTPSGDIATIAVVRLFGFVALSIGDVPLPLPDEVLQEVEIDGAYADSDEMVGQLETNTTYNEFRADLPDHSPSLVVLGQILENVDLLPDDFPLTQSVWTVSFTGQGDSAMTCFVASETGQTFCVERPDFLSVDAEEEEEATTGESAHLTLQTVPNPAVGRDVTVVIESDAEASGLPGEIELLLMNSVGETVRDLSDDPALKSGRIVIDTDDLAAGLYHLILRTTGIQHRLPLIIVQ